MKGVLCFSQREKFNLIPLVKSKFGSKTYRTQSMDLTPFLKPFQNTHIKKHQKYRITFF
jgi:hypothetical protein